MIRTFILPNPKSKLDSFLGLEHIAQGDPAKGVQSVHCNKPLPVEHSSPIFSSPKASAKQDITSGVVVPQIFTANECSKIMLDAKTTGMEGAKILRNGKSIRSFARTCTQCWLPVNPDRKWMYDRIASTTCDANDINYGFNLNDIQTLQVLRYKPLQHFSWHEDTFVGSNRKLTAVFNLSDPKDYFGGGFQIHGVIHNKEYLRHRGAGVWFPSFVRHRAKAPLFGERWVLVAWILGGEFR